MRSLLLMVLIVLLPATGFAASERGYFLVTYEPGSAWDESLGMAQQAGIEGHEARLLDLYDHNILLMSGALVDRPGKLALLLANSIDDARTIVESDPAVSSGLLKVIVTGWNVDMSSMRQFRREVPEVSDPYKPFRIERSDPDAPITIKEQE